MAQEMYLYVSTRFRNLKAIPTLSSNPLHYPGGVANSYREKMEMVSAQSPYGARWFAAECTSYASGDDRGQVGNIYAVYFPINQNETPIQANDKKAGAPCPPFCTDEGLGFR